MTLSLPLPLQLTRQQWIGTPEAKAATLYWTGVIIAARQSDTLAGAFQALRLVGLVPLAGLLLLPLVIETRGKALVD